MRHAKTDQMEDGNANGPETTAKTQHEHEDPGGGRGDQARAAKIYSALNADELALLRSAMPRWIIPLWVCFFVADMSAIGAWYWWVGVLVRLGVGIAAWSAVVCCTPRTPRWAQFLGVVGPFLSYLQAVAILSGEWPTYFHAGVLQVVFLSSALTPLRTGMAIVVYLAATIPTIASFASRIAKTGDDLAVQGVITVLGSIALAVMNGHLVRRARLEKVQAEHELASELRSREETVRRQAMVIAVQKRLESQFSPSISKWIMEEAENERGLAMRRVVIVVFDVADSTAQAARLEAAAYAEVIGGVLEIITREVREHNLAIDKFTGDGVQAIGGFPDSKSDQLQTAVSCCAAVLRRLDKERPRLEAKWRGPLGVRIGVCETDALVGFIGGGEHRTFSAIGAGVSLTHRLCAKAEANTMVVCSRVATGLEEGRMQGLGAGLRVEKRVLRGLKGFGGETFEVMHVEI